jgi:FlaA1/EpsC-like NDP-sugar epimerase
MEALRNNFEATSTLVELAKIHQVKKFVLISSDKAVRPTNIMGATKRLAEISVQAEAAINDKTIFAIVRFGNVIGSSGSAIPIFQNQIENGGPITVTHPDISRYFMSIDEAVALVLQAGEMAQRSEVFVLDMGHPIKILDVVKRMVKANGKSLKTPDNPSGEIEIMFIGLRPGEKLFEELVLGTEVKQTKHDKILCANETYLEKDEITKCLYDVKRIIEAGDNQSVRPYLENLGVLFQFKVDG